MGWYGGDKLVVLVVLVHVESIVVAEVMWLWRQFDDSTWSGVEKAFEMLWWYC